MISGIWKVLARRNEWRDDFGVAIRVQGHDGKVYRAKPIEFEEIQDGMWLEPTINLESHNAQELFQQLWDAGLRPSDGSGNAGHTAALSAHLEDMRTLVFDFVAKRRDPS